MKNMRKMMFAALALAVSIGGYSICMQTVRAAEDEIFSEGDFDSENDEVMAESEDAEDAEITLTDDFTDAPEIIEDESEDQDGEIEILDDESGMQDEEAELQDEEVEIRTEEDAADFEQPQMEGFCGAEDTNISWLLNEDGVLVLKGQGRMADWENQEEVPWFSIREQITGIELDEGITSVGAYAFCGCENVNETQIPDGVQEIGEYAFFNCGGLTTVTIG